ncbi:MAG: cytidylate kinase-like family protein [Ignavibacteriaceae bacterium]|nr:cytidylate kinase-like family protein [Ignavibacteriaceae bacterium]
MLISGALEKAKLYIETHSKEKDLHERGKFEKGPCITISRETGAGADIISNKLIEIFQKYKKPNLPDWTIFEKNLIQKVIEDHNLPKTLTEIFDEKKYSSILSFASEILVGQPSVHTLVYKTTQTILSLAEIGNVIIIGRGGNVVTSNLSNAFHIRLVSTFEDRVKHVTEVYGFDTKQAAEFLKKDDQTRRNYISTYFHKQIDDPLLYHLTINTHRLKHDHAAEIIADAVMTKFPKCFNLSNE